MAFKSFFLRFCALAMAVFVIGALLHCNPDHRVCSDLRGENENTAASGSLPVSGDSPDEDSSSADGDCACAFCLYVGFANSSETFQSLVGSNVHLKPDVFTLGQFSLEIFRPPLFLS